MKSLTKMFGEVQEGAVIAPPTDEGGGFSHIAPVIMRMLARVNIQNKHLAGVGVDLSNPEAQPQGYVFHQAMGTEWTSIYFNTREAANRLCGLLPKNDAGPQEYDYRSETVWHMMYSAAEVINVRDIDDLVKRNERTGGVVMGDRVVVKTYHKRAGKTRHIFHMMALPSMVSAVARWQGIDVEPYDLSELTSGQAYTDAEFARLMGDPDGDWRETSELWKQRAALWAALGENDVSKYVPSMKGGKYATAALALDQILTHVVYRSWEEPIWCRVESYADPHPDAQYTYTDDHDEEQIRHSRIRVVTEIFDDEAAAIAAAVADFEAGDGELAPRIGGEEYAEAVVAGEGNWPPLPQDYIDAEYTIAQFLGDLAEHDGKGEKLAAKALGIEVEELQAWRAARDANKG